LEHANTAVLNSRNSADAKRGYRHAIDVFVDWYCSEPRLAFDRIVVLRYRSHLETLQLAPGTINLRLGAVRRLADEASVNATPGREEITSASFNEARRRAKVLNLPRIGRGGNQYGIPTWFGRTMHIRQQHNSITHWHRNVVIMCRAVGRL
jgi:hypothetical protein